MSYTLKVQQIAVKDPDTGTYSGVDVLTEQTKSGLLAEIQAEGAAQRTSVTNTGTTQVSAVQAKGAETLASIPSDYTALSNEVDDLKNTLTQLDEDKAERSDLILPSLTLTGTKNTTGSQIVAGTYFYLNGELTLATQNIGNNSDFTSSNKKTVTVGEELTALNSNLTGVKTYADSAQSPSIYRNISASDIDTVNITVPEANYGYIVGFAIESNVNIALIQFYMSSKTTIHCRVRNLANSATTYQVKAYYI